MQPSKSKHDNNNIVYVWHVLFLFLVSLFPLLSENYQCLIFFVYMLIFFRKGVLIILVGPPLSSPASASSWLAPLPKLHARP